MRVVGGLTSALGVQESLRTGLYITTLSLLQVVIEQCTTPMLPPIQGHLQCLKYAISALFTDIGIGALGVGFANGKLQISDMTRQLDCIMTKNGLSNSYT